MMKMACISVGNSSQQSHKRESADFSNGRQLPPPVKNGGANSLVLNFVSKPP